MHPRYPKPEVQGCTVEGLGQGCAGFKVLALVFRGLGPSGCFQRFGIRIWAQRQSAEALVLQGDGLKALQGLWLLQKPE